MNVYWEKLRRDPFAFLAVNKNLSTLATNDRHCTAVVYFTILFIIIIIIINISHYCFFQEIDEMTPVHLHNRP